MNNRVVFVIDEGCAIWRDLWDDSNMPLALAIKNGNGNKGQQPANYGSTSEPFEIFLPDYDISKCHQSNCYSTRGGADKKGWRTTCKPGPPLKRTKALHQK